MDILTPPLVKAVVLQFKLPLSSIHGPAHWMRVRTNGLELAASTGANPIVIELFALFHDSCRENDGQDPMHGPRGAALVEIFHQKGLFQCRSDELHSLMTACHGHTHEKNSSDITIATCWDADRLDLPRVGITPSPHRLCTDAARNDSMILRARTRAESWLNKTCRTHEA